MQAIYNLLQPYDNVKGLYYWGGEYIWAGDIGGSWSSLFHWQGNAYQAITALKGFMPTSVNEPFNQKHIQLSVIDQSVYVNLNPTINGQVIAELFNLSGVLLQQEKWVEAIIYWRYLMCRKACM